MLVSIPKEGAWEWGVFCGSELEHKQKDLRPYVP